MKEEMLDKDRTVESDRRKTEELGVLSLQLVTPTPKPWIRIF